MPPFRARTSRLPSFSVTAISTFVLSAFGIKPVFGRRNELLELAPEGFGQLGGSGRQNGPKPALFAEADDGRADPLVAKRYLQGRRGKVSAPILAQVRHASYRSQCCLAGRAIPVILVRAPWPGKDAAAVDGRIHNSNSSVLSLFDQRGGASVDEGPAIVHQQDFEYTQIEVASHLYDITSRDAYVPNLSALAQLDQCVNRSAGLRHHREVMELRVVQVDQWQRRQTETPLALANCLTHAGAREVSAAGMDFCGNHEIFGKSARPGDACTDSTFAASLRVSIRGVKEPDRAGAVSYTHLRA